MGEIKKICKVWTIADYNEEELWLRELHKSGWKLSKMVPPCLFYFEKCQPEDVIYRLDYKQNNGSGDYIEMLADFGWEYVGKCVGWIYVRKPASAVENENDGELFSDDQSRIDRVESLCKTRILPLCVIFLCSVLPNFVKIYEGSHGYFFTVFWGIMFALYSFLLVYCGVKLKKLRRELIEK